MERTCRIWLQVPYLLLDKARVDAYKMLMRLTCYLSESICKKRKRKTLQLVKRNYDRASEVAVTRLGRNTIHRTSKVQALKFLCKGQAVCYQQGGVSSRTREEEAQDSPRTPEGKESSKVLVCPCILLHQRSRIFDLYCNRSKEGSRGLVVCVLRYSSFM